MNIRVVSVLLAAIVLAGCTNPFAKKDDFQTVVKSHFTALGKSMNTESFENFIGKTTFDGNLTAQSKNQGFAIDFKSESKVHLSDSETSLNLSGSLNAPGMPAMGAQAVLGAIFASGTGYVKLDKFELTGNEKNPMFDGMVENAMQSYGGKWLTLPAGDKSTLINAHTNPLAIKAAFENHPVLAMTKDLGYNEGKYNYEVSLDNTQALALTEELHKILTGTGLTTEALTATKKDLENTKLTGTLSVDNNNRAYGSFQGNITVTSSASGSTTPPEVVAISYNNSADNFNFEASAGGEKITLAVTKELTKANGTLSYTDAQKKPTVIKFTIEKTLSGYSFNASGDIDLPTGEQMNLKTNGNLTTQKDASIKIEAPKETTDMNQIIG
ncbi:MAG: hypothetical protein ACOYN2_00840 [Patescibacteria group bacterium]